MRNMANRRSRVGAPTRVHSPDEHDYRDGEHSEPDQYARAESTLVDQVDGVGAVTTRGANARDRHAKQEDRRRERRTDHGEGAVGGDLRVVGDDHHGCRGLSGDPHDLGHHLFAGESVEGAGWFVREEHRRLGDHGPGSSHALCLTTRHLRWPRSCLISDSEAVEPGGRRSNGRFALDARQQEWQRNVLGRGEFGNQLAELEEDADVGASQLGSRCFALVGDEPVTDSYFARSSHCRSASR